MTIDNKHFNSLLVMSLSLALACKLHISILLSVVYLQVQAKMTLKVTKNVYLCSVVHYHHTYMSVLARLFYTTLLYSETGVNKGIHDFSFFLL